MTAELARYDQPTVELEAIPADPTGGRLVAWASGLTAAHRIGSALCATSFCPQHFRGKPDEAAAAILFGDEIGLTPTQALRSVHVISGTPGLYARTMVALVLSHGHKVWTVEKSDSKVTVAGQRRGSSVVEQETWTVARARQAGYTNNKKYTTDPQAMLYARAAADVCRRVAPDALAGLAYTVEELEISEPEQTVAVKRSPSTTRVQRAQPAPVEPSLDPDAPIDLIPSEDGVTKVAAGPQGADESGAVSGFDPQPSAPTSDPRDVPATRAQVQKLNILLQEAGITDRAEKLAYLSGNVGRDLESSKDLTKAEAHSLIDALESESQAERDADQGEEPAWLPGEEPTL